MEWKNWWDCLERVNNIILKHGYHNAGILVNCVFSALGKAKYGCGYKDRIKEALEKLREELSWMRQLTLDEAELIELYLFKATSLAYRYHRLPRFKKKRR